MYLGRIDGFEHIKVNNRIINFSFIPHCSLDYSFGKQNFGNVFIKLPFMRKRDYGIPIGLFIKTYEGFPDRIMIRNTILQRNGPSKFPYKTVFFGMSFNCNDAYKDYSKVYYFFWSDEKGRLFLEVVPKGNVYDFVDIFERL